MIGGHQRWPLRAKQETLVSANDPSVHDRRACLGAEPIHATFPRGDPRLVQQSDLAGRSQRFPGPQGREKLPQSEWPRRVHRNHPAKSAGLQNTQPAACDRVIQRMGMGNGEDHPDRAGESRE